MIKVGQVEPLSMGWCLDCHRNPEPNLRDPKDVTKMFDEGAAPAGVVNAASGGAPRRKVSPPVHCSGCHR
jgi:hypothetical protein